MHQQQTAFKNIVGKGEIARNEQFLLFPQCFLLNQIIVSPFIHTFDIIYLLAIELEKRKIFISSKGLILLKLSLNSTQGSMIGLCHAFTKVLKLHSLLK